jgi:hypothetical protein
MKRVYKLAKFMNECAVRPVYKNDKLELMVLSNDLYRAKYDQHTGALIEFAYPFQFTDKYNYIQTRFHVWTAETYVQKDLDWRDKKFEYYDVNK